MGKMQLNKKMECNEKLKISSGEDHRELNKRFEYFAYENQVGAGLPLWLPNGTIIRDELEVFIKELEFKAGYKRVSTPHMAKESLYEKSGHLAHYEESMFPPIDDRPVGIIGDNVDGGGATCSDESGSRSSSAEQRYRLRPMNCPHHHLVFSSRKRSYRELPLRLAEYGQVYRYEGSGAISGLMRARGFCQNDAHIYCSREDAINEIEAVLSMYAEAYSVLGIEEFRFRLSRRSSESESESGDGQRSAGKRSTEKFAGDLPDWSWAEGVLREVLSRRRLEFFEEEGEAAFYGPKIDVQIRSRSGKEETASTIQLDFVSAERLDLAYVGADGSMHRPVIIHRAPLGSHERIVALLIEKHQGAFPTWLSPLQVKILPVVDRHREAACILASQLRSCFLRAEIDSSGESLSKRVREAAQLRVPYVIVFGDREATGESLIVRRRGAERTFEISRGRFVEGLLREVQERRRWAVVGG